MRVAHGDSGGPVVAYRGMHSLVGTRLSAVPDDKTMAVALSPHYGWIRETMEKLGDALSARGPTPPPPLPA